MLSIEDLKNIANTPNEEEISLSLLAEFYERYISNRIYELYLDNGNKLIFYALNRHFPHLIGLHKFQDKNHSNNLLHRMKELKKDRGFNNIKNKSILLDDLKSVHGNNKMYKQYKKRILNIPFTYQLLRKGVFLVYDKDKVGKKTKIKGNYMFVDNVTDKNLKISKLHFFFINQTEEEMHKMLQDILKDTSIKDESVPITFLTTKEDDYIFVENQDILRVNKIVIKDFTSNEIIEQYNFNEESYDIVGQGRVLN